MHSHVSHRAKFDDDDLNSFRGIACEGRTHAHTHFCLVHPKLVKSRKRKRRNSWPERFRFPVGSAMSAWSLSPPCQWRQRTPSSDDCRVSTSTLLETTNNSYGWKFNLPSSLYRLHESVRSTENCCLQHFANGDGNEKAGLFLNKFL